MLRYAVDKPGGPVRAIEAEDPPLGPREVDVRVTHCGVCNTDVSLIDDVYGISRFPLVAGHEAVGIVEAFGHEVELTIGQRVGVGAVAGSCQACEWCLSGRQNLCPRKDLTAVRGDRGGFAGVVRAGDWRYVQPIPDALDSAAVAPLLCAGATVFPPLLRHGVRPIDRVAVVGVGGLGHLAIQFAAAWGCHVTAISSTADKETDARRFGAHDVLVGHDPAPGSFDFVLSTVPADLPWNTYADALRPGGTLCLVGVPHEPLSIAPMTLLTGERTITAGNVGTPIEQRAMLEFAARHGIVAQTETYPVARIDEALDRVRQGAARYRVVLEM
ncbi:NAD(P)-dependent alcohol dehydrogenase [Cryptosporangium sp. NPDC051539]|uniref:NAD(P)-dependent alcohol dehydrogenase n=1 Tax=Cryptosporangium sp. NPDC051539 TaxID=3363962 RepID=UPI00379EE99A